jgi:hypothetical protein
MTIMYDLFTSWFSTKAGLTGQMLSDVTGRFGGAA